MSTYDHTACPLKHLRPLESIYLSFEWKGLYDMITQQTHFYKQELHMCYNGVITDLNTKWNAACFFSVAVVRNN